ncbi:hypothetical protein A3D03_06120 [Candidatus Gottesmanbacteria bacterium RIFCSPHIGHO2_02_FULL_40_13]|uniref:Calcineurin-like phosphoesterase domain-containing protein n=1 Tax=Candidatus Gottesmanbacteria bacterium RIFCSPHIGHO2_02_FULL_40_13 TaxID=1798384 RepID=A0A1F6A780_9BACT|nr:MAG: hypothetical protein A3D03_06120 [Candidatus Gottesmanbacteria bacterium RIFCSPHIGHO2_02_FULL_40_13]
MHIIIISDLHLTRRFDKRKFYFLKKIIEQSDQVIINGDLWDYYFLSFSQFIQSRWSQLFPLLKEKKAIYLYGNHDQEKWCDYRVNEFSIKQCDRFIIKVKNCVLRIEHGNRIAKAPDDKYPWITEFRSTMATVILLSRKFLLSKLGKERLKKFNIIMISWWKNNRKSNQWLVCGHSHVKEYNSSQRFINTGYVGYGIGQYLKIDDNGFQLVEDRY